MEPMMNNARLRFLASRHAPRRAVVAKDVRTNGTTLTLECGHTGECVPHVSADTIKDWACGDCGAEIVRTAAQYASEF
jgi:hypothetical protein